MSETSTTRWSLLLAPLVLLVACDDGNGSSSNALPSDPAQWVCPETSQGASQQEIDAWCVANPDRGLPADLPAPAPLSRLADKNAFEADVLNPFVRQRQYVALGWKSDAEWRFTGPYVGSIGDGESYGTHPAVRIYYSPEIIDWLCDGRDGEIPDGAVIVKEMHSIEPCLDIALDDEGCMVIKTDPAPNSWAVMIKASTASQDGWYWAGASLAPDDPPMFEWQLGNPAIFDRSAITSEDFFAASFPPSEPNPLWYPTGYVFQDGEKLSDAVPPFNGFGTDCINCHASAATESTFSAIDNLIGPGLRFKGFDFAPGDCGDDVMDDNYPGREHAPGVKSLIDIENTTDPYPSPFTNALAQPLPGFTDFFDQIMPVTFGEAWEQRLPAETYDHVVASAEGPAEFLTSDQCAPCHDATVSNAGTPNMVFENTEPDGTKTNVNLSPYGEWKASPMGLAGRDPIFFAQLQSETNNLPQLSTCIETTCLHCHGVMGQRQLAIDTQGENDDGCKDLFGVAPPAEVPFGRPFRRAMVTQWPDSVPSTEQRYGALARDGVSCAVCHHIADTDLGNESTYTGNFVTGPADELYGPYDDDTVVTDPMENALGTTPQLGAQIQGSDLCGSCHNILLPVFDNDGTLMGHGFEQTTHLEWVNSDFAPGRRDFRSCQDCHMPTEYNGRSLSSVIANIESNLFAPVSYRLADDKIELTERKHYARHSLHGLNVFINQMFQQFPVLLGYRQISYQTGTLTGPPLLTGLQSMFDMAANDTAAVEVQKLEKTADGKLQASVLVTNKTGHYLPSGVGFRRLFIEFLVLDADDNVLWASGRTNDLGAIVAGRTQQVLAVENVAPEGADQCVKNPDIPYEPHHQVVDSEDQVQIYQELVKDSAGVLTTSFLRRVDEVKDNRLRAKGFDPAMFASSPSPFIRELAVLHGEARFDDHYFDPALTGTDEIEYLALLDEGDLDRVDHVQVTLYNQSIPPFYLQQRFRDANCGARRSDDIERLYYLTSHLNVDDPMDEEGSHPIADWKLRVASTTRALR
jgi:hypothetical protein